MSERIYNLNDYIVDSACLNYMTGNAKKFLNMHHCDGIKVVVTADTLICEAHG